MKGQCQFIHLIMDVPMAVDDEQNTEAHKVILAAPSPDYKEQYEKANETIDDITKLNDEYKLEIEQLKSKLNEDKNERQKSKKEMEKLKAENLYFNLCKIENENLKKEVNQFKDSEKEKETVHKNEIEELKNKIKLHNFEKAKMSNNKTEYEPKDTKDKIITYNCKDCGFTTNWWNKFKDHIVKCKTKKSKK